MQNLITIRQAAFAAWAAAGRKATGPEREALDAAAKAVAAAKKAETEAAAPALAAKVAAAVAAQEQRQSAAANLSALRRAERLFDAAQEWPRCGQDWPATAAEKAAQRILDAHGVETA